MFFYHPEPRFRFEVQGPCGLPSAFPFPSCPGLHSRGSWRKWKASFGWCERPGVCITTCVQRNHLSFNSQLSLPSTCERFFLKDLLQSVLWFRSNLLPLTFLNPEMLDSYIILHQLLPFTAISTTPSLHFSMLLPVSKALKSFMFAFILETLTPPSYSTFLTAQNILQTFQAWF